MVDAWTSQTQNLRAVNVPCTCSRQHCSVGSRAQYRLDGVLGSYPIGVSRIRKAPRSLAVQPYGLCKDFRRLIIEASRSSSNSWLNLISRLAGIGQLVM